MAEVGKTAEMAPTAPRSDRPWYLRPFTVAWGAIFIATAVLMVLGKQEVRWAFKVPREMRLPLRRQISDLMDWLINTADLGLFTFYEFTRGIAWVMEVPLDLATSILSTGFLKGQGSDAVQITHSGRKSRTLDR